MISHIAVNLNLNTHFAVTREWLEAHQIPADEPSEIQKRAVLVALLSEGALDEALNRGMRVYPVMEDE